MGFHQRVLTLTGSASVADYQAALRSITYANLSDHPSTITRTVRFNVNDGSLDSTVVTRDIQIVAVNDEEVLSLHSGITVQENSLSNVISASMLRTDDLDNTGSELVYIITSATTHGTLRRNGVSLALGDTFTQADVDANLLTYDHDGSEQFNDAFSFSVDDNQGTTSGATFAIAITPVNDHAPIITSHSGAATVNLNIAENSIAVASIIATDADLPAQSLTYAIQGGTDGNHFAIDSVTGQLTFISAPDRENPTDLDGDGTYEVVVQVTDGQFITAQTIRVTVTDQNEFAVSTITDNDTAANTVTENAAIGTSVGIRGFAFDSDSTNNIVTYSLLDNPDGLFQINATTGEVTTAAAIDRETHGANRTITFTSTIQ